MAQTALVTESTLTERYQTTVPSTVRKALHLSKRDKIKFTIQPDGNVMLSRVEEPGEDPVLNEFLSFLANDMQKHPEKFQSLSASLKASVDNLILDIDVDLEAPLSDEDD